MISNQIIKLVQQLTMLVVSLFAVPLAFAQSSPAADMQLVTDLHHMQVQVNQSAPLPPGGCNSGYTWHTTYGGCRKPQIETETAACAANHTGSRTRTRTGYALQANGSDIKYGQWSAWAENCLEKENNVIPAINISHTVVPMDAGPGFCWIFSQSGKMNCIGPQNMGAWVQVREGKDEYTRILAYHYGPPVLFYYLIRCPKSHLKITQPYPPLTVADIPIISEYSPFLKNLPLQGSINCHKN